MDKILIVANPNNMSGVDYHRMVIPHINQQKYFDIHFINEIDSVGVDEYFPNSELKFKDFALIIFSRTVSKIAGQTQKTLDKIISLKQWKVMKLSDPLKTDIKFFKMVDKLIKRE